MRISDWSSDVCSSDLVKEYNAAIGGKLLRTPKAVEATPCKSCEEGKAVTLGALARQQEKRRGGQGGCNANLQYGMAWANRMPAEFPVCPKAKLMEAARADGGGCAFPVVSFVTTQPMQNIIEVSRPHVGTQVHNEHDG